MIWKAVLLSFYLMCSSFAMEHGIYITVIEINYDDDHGQVVIKSFSDDLQNALRAMNFNIPQDSNPCEERDALDAYIDQHLKIDMNGNAMDLEVSNCSIESDTHWIYLDFELEGNLENVKVETDWMTELFGNQQNIIKVRAGDQRLNDRLSGDRTLSELTIDN